MLSRIISMCAGNKAAVIEGTPSISPSSIAAQFDFYDNDIINSVNERFLKVGGNNTTVTNNKLVTSNSADFVSTESIIFEGNEDFTIQAKFNYTGTSGANVPIIFNWIDLNNVKSKWYLLWEAANSGRIVFYYMASGTMRSISFICPKPAFNIDHHYAVTRKNGVMYLFINGTVVATSSISGGHTHDSNIFTGLNDGVTALYGRRWDVQIFKGIALWDANFVVPGALLRLTREEYLDDKVVCQVDFRRNNAVNESNGKYIKRNSTVTVAQGRMSTTTAVASQFSVPVEYWGAGDFTIEATITVKAALAANVSAVLLGDWFNGTGGDNRWCISHAQTTSKFAFALARSTASVDYPVIYAPANYVVGRPHHVVVERRNGVITMYQDGVAGTPVSQSTPMRGTAPFEVSNFLSGATQTTSADVTDIRIADKALYEGVIKKPLAFPKVKSVPDYTAAELADILVQCSGERGMVRNEKTNTLVSIAGTARRINNAITTTAAYSSQLSIPAPVLPSRSDMTFECKFSVPALQATGYPLICQWDGAGTQNSWSLHLVNSNLSFSLAESGGTGNSGGDRVDVAIGAIVANRDYHVVIEIVSNVVNAYLDGVLVNTKSQLANFINSSTPIKNVWGPTSSTNFGPASIWDIRIAKRALFNGVITKKRFPRIGRKPHLTASVGTSSLGAYPGACQNVTYGSTKEISLGAFSDTLFKDTRTVPAKTVRLLNLTHDRNLYIILGFKPTDIPPTDDMPIFTNTLVFNGTTLAGIAATIAGGATATQFKDIGATACYWTLSDTATVAAFGDSCHIPFEFI